jgi:hypothetical protein
MKNVILISLFLLIGTCNIMAVPLYFTVQNGETATHYASLTAAITAAPSGSTVLIPNGDITSGTITINKKLNLVGTGHYPNTGSRTILRCSIILTLGADSGSIQGIYLDGDLRFGNSGVSDSVADYKIFRCRISTLYLGYDEAYPNVNNINIIECLINTIYGYNSENCYLIKNYVAGLVYGLDNAQLLNNIFYGNTYSNLPLVSDCKSLIVANNVFTCGDQNYGVYVLTINCVWKNNIIRLQVYSWGQNDVINNLTSISSDRIFTSNTNFYDYYKSYQLTSNSPGKNFGTDGTDLGVYGSDTPSKAYAEPSIPYINSRETAIQSVNNKLPIKFGVKSQTK